MIAHPLNIIENNCYLQGSNKPVTGTSRAHYQNTHQYDLLRWMQVEQVGWDHERFLDNLCENWR